MSRLINGIVTAQWNPFFIEQLHGIQFSAVKAIAGLLATLLLTTSTACFALSTDSSQPIEFAADSADINNHTGIGQYQGNITLVQGSTHLTALKATTFTNKQNQLVKGIAVGDSKNPVHYWTLTDPKKPELHAYAETIEFYPPKHLIYLIGNAKVIQGKDSYSAPMIQYDTQNEHVISSHNPKQRTTIIIHPQKENT